MADTRKIKAGLVKFPVTDFIGEEGNIFFNASNGDLRFSDGLTPGGLPIGGGNISVGVVDTSNTLIENYTNVTKLHFDSDSGFDIEQLDNDTVKVQMNSTFKTWKVNGQQDLVAIGLDTIELIAGDGIILTTNTAENPYKSLTIEADTSNLIGVILDMDIDQDGYLILSHVDTFDTNNAFINNDGNFILTDGT